MLFVDPILNYNELLNIGYNNRFLDEVCTPCFLYLFLFLTTGIAAGFRMHTLKIRQFKTYCYWFNCYSLRLLFLDLSIALGKTDRIPLILSVWAPTIALSFFTFIGVLQINEK